MTAAASEYAQERRSYWIGLGLALLLTAIPFGAVAWSGWPRSWLLPLIALCAIVQVVVHIRFFLHVKLSQSNRDDLQLILFSALIICLMVGGTLWILSNLAHRMAS